MKPEEKFSGASGDRLARIEVQRKQRGLFALIRAIIRGSSGEDVEDYKAHLNGRLDALTRLTATIGTEGRVDLALIISEELLAQGAAEGERIVIRGPEVKLRSDDAQTLSLAFHELAANAVKFGDLADGASVSVTWVHDAGVVRLKWCEQEGGHYPETPGEPGFGARWLTETLPYELGAKVDYEIDAKGVVCAITFPLR